MKVMKMSIIKHKKRKSNRVLIKIGWLIFLILFIFSTIVLADPVTYYSCRPATEGAGRLTCYYQLAPNDVRSDTFTPTGGITQDNLIGQVVLRQSNRIVILPPGMTTENLDLTRVRIIEGTSSNPIISNENLIVGPGSEQAPTPPSQPITPAPGATAPPPPAATGTPPSPEPTAPPTQPREPPAGAERFTAIAHSDVQGDISTPIIRIGLNLYAVEGQDVVIEMVDGRARYVGGVEVTGVEQQGTGDLVKLSILSRVETYVHANQNGLITTPSQRTLDLQRGYDLGLPASELVYIPSDQIDTVVNRERQDVLSRARAWDVPITDQEGHALTTPEIEEAITQQRSSIIETHHVDATADDAEAQINSIRDAKSLGIPVPEGDISPEEWETIDSRLALAQHANEIGVHIPDDALATDGGVEALTRDVARKQDLMNALAVPPGEGNRPILSGESSGYTTDQLQALVDLRTKLQGLTGNPDEWATACGDSGACTTMTPGVDGEGKSFLDLTVPGEEGSEGGAAEIRVYTGYTYWDCSGDSCEPLDCGGECTEQQVSGEGIEMVDPNGDRFESDGFDVYILKADGTREETPYESVEACRAASPEGACRVQSRGRSRENYYWTPNTWTDMIRGGPAVNTIRSLSSMIPGMSDFWGYYGIGAGASVKKWVDRWFNLENLVTAELCTIDSRIPSGVGISLSGNMFPTATIQAQRFEICPCKWMPPGGREACIANQSISSYDYCYPVYRITGRVAPMDCSFKFNIKLDDKPIYKEDRVAERGAAMFDITGANAIVTKKGAEVPQDAKSICIAFSEPSDLSTCFRLSGTQEICNSVFVSGSDDVTQRPSSQEGSSTGGGGGGGPRTSSTREDCTVC